MYEDANDAVSHGRAHVIKNARRIGTFHTTVNSKAMLLAETVCDFLKAGVVYHGRFGIG